MRSVDQANGAFCVRGNASIVRNCSIGAAAFFIVASASPFLNYSIYTSLLLWTSGIMLLLLAFRHGKIVIELRGCNIIHYGLLSKTTMDVKATKVEIDRSVVRFAEARVVRLYYIRDLSPSYTELIERIERQRLSYAS